MKGSTFLLLLHLIMLSDGAIIDAEGSGSTIVMISSDETTTTYISQETTDMFSNSGDDTTDFTPNPSTSDTPVSISGSTTTRPPQVVTTTTQKVTECKPETCKDQLTYCEVINNNPTCSCKPGSYYKAPSVCEQALQYGGQLILVETARRKRETDEDELEIVTNFLVGAYHTLNGYLEVKVSNISDGLVYDYELYFETNSSITEEKISDEFESYLNETANCTENVCQASSLHIKKDESISKAGTVDEVVCQSYSTYCDKESTTCVVNEGFATCDCTDDHVFVLGNDRFCAAIVCRTSMDCNSPFGWCDAPANDDVGECTCMFGFDGDHCKNPWLFIFVIVACFFGLVLILTITYVCYAKRKSPKKAIENGSGKATIENPYYDLGQDPYGNVLDSKMRAKVPKDLNLDDRYEASSSF